MELTLLGTDFSVIDTVDEFESIIWTEKYNTCGDFEISVPITTKIVGSLIEDRYLIQKNSDVTMIIEGLSIDSNSKTGNTVIVKGRSLESVLRRRIVWNQTILAGNFQLAIKKLLDESIIAPSLTKRRIPEVVFLVSEDPIFADLEVDQQLTGEFVYDAVASLCISAGVGFKVVLTDDNKFQFQLYVGKDRSYSQEANPYIVFSPQYENLLNSRYDEDKSFLRTSTLVAGEGEGAARVMVEVDLDNSTGLARREMFTDARDLSKSIDGGTLTDADYEAQLRQRGLEDLAENIFVQTFEGQIDASSMFVYAVDYFLGDIVEVANEYGHQTKSRVVEVIRSQDKVGVKVYPTFSANV